MIFGIADPGTGTGQLIIITAIHAIVSNSPGHLQQPVLPELRSGAHNSVGTVIIFKIPLSVRPDHTVFQKFFALRPVHIVSAVGITVYTRVAVWMDIYTVFQQFGYRFFILLADRPVGQGPFVHIEPLTVP